MTEEELKKAYGDVFSSEAGRKVLIDLVEYSGFFHPDKSDASPDVVLHNEGLRKMVLRIIENNPNCLIYLANSITKQDRRVKYTIGNDKEDASLIMADK